MTDCTERHSPQVSNGLAGEGHEGMPERSRVTDCTERHSPQVSNGLAGEGHEGMPERGSA